MKIYMMTDLEGVAGVTAFEDRKIDTHDNHEKRMQMRRLLTGEVNAAIDGLFGEWTDPEDLLAHLGHPIHILWSLSGEPQHEVELHRPPTGSEQSLGALEELLVR